MGGGQPRGTEPSAVGSDVISVLTVLELQDTQLVSENPLGLELGAEL